MNDDQTQASNQASNQAKASSQTRISKKWSRLPLMVMAALPLTTGLAFAQTNGGSSTNSATPPPQRMQPAPPNRVRPTQQGQPQQPSRTNYADVFLQKLAAALGTTPEKLKAAAVTAGNATLDQGVKAGDFPHERANHLKQRLQNNPFALASGRTAAPGNFKDRGRFGNQSGAGSRGK